LSPKHLYALHFDIVHGCQLRCVGCPNSTLEPKIQRISVDDFAQCLGNIDVERIHTLRLFNYGEPLLHKQLASIVAEIPKQRWKASCVEISTNAQWVDWHELEEAIKQEVLTRLVVSCDGDGSPEQYEALRPPSKWEKLIEFLDRAAYLRDRWAPAMQLWTRTVVRTRKDMDRWNEVLQPRGWTPEFRRWMALPESAKNMTGRATITPNAPCVFWRNRRSSPRTPGSARSTSSTWMPTAPWSPAACIRAPGEFGNLMTQKYSEIVAGDPRRKFKDELATGRATDVHLRHLRRRPRRQGRPVLLERHHLLEPEQVGASRGLGVRPLRPLRGQTPRPR
jgi:hypothetical protein